MIDSYLKKKKMITIRFRFGAQVLPVKYNKILLKSRKVDTSVHTYLYGPLRNIIKSLIYNLKLS